MTSSMENINVVKISYPDDVKSWLEQLYEVKKSGEKSKEALAVARRCIVANPSGYTAWKLYCTIMQHLGCPLDEEVEAVIEDNPKNYQQWNFRRLSYYAGLTSAVEELDNADVAIRLDNKNYHAWANRQDLLNHEAKKGNVEMWKYELKFVEQLLRFDMFNNSLWSQRAIGLQFLDHTEQHQEVEGAIEVLRLAPHSIAAWNYLRFLLLDHRQDSKQLKDVIQFCHETLSKDKFCLPCLEVLGEIYVVIGTSSLQKNLPFAKSCLQSAEKVWKSCLIIDPIRTNYYQSRNQHINTILSQDLESNQG